MGRPKKITPAVEKAPARLAGSFDLLPDQHLLWGNFLEKFNILASTFGYTKIDTPAIENAKLFKFWQHAGENQLVTFSDAKGATIATKPTNLFGLARIYLDHRFFELERVSKWFYHSPVAYISPAGEIKQNHEYGFHIFGQIAPIADAQVINMLIKLYTDLGIGNLSLEVNNIGCLECLPAYQDVLKNYFREKKYDLCENCINYLDTNSPHRILACSNLSCSTVSAEAPALMDFLCDPCRRHFIGVLEGLDELSVVYNLNQKVVGKPWSRKTVFQIRTRFGTDEVSLGLGGHADDLIQSLGGPITQSLGFSGRMDGIMRAMDLAQVKFTNKNKVDVYLVPLGDLAAKKTLKLFTDLWSNGISASEYVGPGSIKTQLKLAESNKISIALIIGQKEARDGTVILRDVRSGMQELFTVDRIIEEVKKRLEK